MLYVQQKVLPDQYFNSKGIPVDEGMRNLQALKGSRILIKIGGECLNNGGYDSIGESLADLDTLGITPTILHGGGSQIDRLMEERKLKIVKANGLRTVPDQDTLDCVLEGLGEVNSKLVDAVNKYALEKYSMENVAVGATKDPVVYAQKMQPVFDKETGKLVDLGSVGTVVGINYTNLRKDGKMPILWCIGYDKDGQTLNVNADMVGEALALQHNRYISLTPTGGYIKNDEIVLEMSLEEARKHNANGGMGLKIDSLMRVVENTDIEPIIASPENLPFELFLDRGKGTMIRQPQTLTSIPELPQ